MLLPFSTSTITISVDAGKTFYSYFRNGGTWDQLEKNIKKFREYNDYTWLDITCTTSIYQMLDIYDVFESFISLEASVNISIVQSPKYLDPSLILLDLNWVLMNTNYLKYLFIPLMGMFLLSSCEDKKEEDNTPLPSA